MRRDVQAVGVEVRIESAQREDEVGVVAPSQPQRQVAGQRVDKDAGIVERAIDGKCLGAEIEHTEHVDVQLDQRLVGRWQPSVDQTEQHQADRIGHFENHADRQRNQRRCSPADLQHRPEEVATFAPAGRSSRCC